MSNIYFFKPCHGSTYLFEVLSWKFVLLQPYVGWLKLKIYSPTNFPIYTWQLLETNLLSKITIFFCPTNIYLFEFSNINSRIKCKTCLKLTIEVPDVILVSLLLTLPVLVFLCWLETCSGSCLNLNLYLHFRVWSRSPISFKTKLYVTTVDNIFQPLAPS